MIIRRVGPISVAKIAGIVYAIFGLFAGALVSCLALFGAFAASLGRNSGTPLPPLIGALLGTGAIIILPVFYGVLGFLSALIGAWLYNVIAAKAGGIEIDVA